jgi:hypothetical protein
MVRVSICTNRTGALAFPALEPFLSIKHFYVEG